MPLGDLKIEFGHEFREKSYRRSLDLSRSVCAVEYETPDGVRFTREVRLRAGSDADCGAARVGKVRARIYRVAEYAAACNRKWNLSGCAMPVAREAGIRA